MSKNNWTNRLSFIITFAAFAVGLGNIWRFPYIAGEDGGGAFLLVYLLLVVLIGIPILMMEIGLGRMAQTTSLMGYGKLSGQKIWNGLGWLELPFFNMPTPIKDSGLPVLELPASDRRYNQGLWIGIYRNPETGELQAVSPPYATGKALAY